MVKMHWERWRNTKDIRQGANSARNSIAMQGFNSVCEGFNRKRSYSYHVVRGSLAERRGTQESEMSNMTNRVARPSLPLAQDHRKLDGPLVAQPDLVKDIKEENL